MRKHGGTPSWPDKHVTLAANSPPGVARGRFVGGEQSGLAGCKPPPLFTRGVSSCSSQGRRQGEPWGASPRPSAPTYLPTYLCERQCRKACNLRSAAEELEETGSNGRARRYRKHGSPKPVAEARAMETDPSPVRLWSAADSEGHSDGYWTAFPSELGEMARPP